MPSSRKHRMTSCNNFQIGVVATDRDKMKLLFHKSDFNGPKLSLVGDKLAEPENRYLPPSNQQLLLFGFNIQYFYLHFNETDRKQR